MAPNTQIGKVTFPEQIDPNENRFKRDDYQRQTQFMEDLQSGVYLEFCTRWLNLASYGDLYDDIINYFTNIKASQQPLRTFSFESGMMIPFYHIPENSVVNPFIKFDGAYNPFDRYYHLSNKCRRDINDVFNK